MALNAGMALLALAICATLVRGLDALDAPFTVPWWALAVSFALAEKFVVHLQIGKNAHTVSLSEAALVIGLFFADPLTLLLAQSLGAAVTLMFHRKQSALRLTFNLSQLTLSTAVAALVFHSVVRLGDPLGPAGWAAAFAAAYVSDWISALAIACVISVAEEQERFSWPLKLDATSGYVFATTCLAIVATTILWERPTVAWLLPVLAATMYLGYRSFSSLKHKHETLQLLYESTALADHESRLDPIVARMLGQARRMFRAEIGEITLFNSEPGQRAMRYVMRADDRIETTSSLELDAQEGVWARVAAENQGVLLPHPITNDSLRAFFAERGIKDAMVAPLRHQTVVVGTFLVANRLGEFSTFDEDDLKMLETLASHASVALENGQLVESLREEAERNEYQALHDALTGLPNRTLFNDRAREALALDRDTPAAVMLIDLDHFKDVNDTLGHQNGDLLLQEVGKRLSGSVHEGDTVARLGGDEFTVLLASVPGREAAQRAADRILQALNRPVDLGDVTIDVRASAGIAISPEHGRDPDTLLQRADVAMYLAKAAHSGFEIYAPERDQYSAQRLALVAELRNAIERGELGVHYQPKAELRTGRVVGMEALVRWYHPRDGFIPPDEFIPIAERTGLIRPLSLHVLDTALADRREWSRLGVDLKVSVNLSIRNLLDTDLPRDIARTLQRWDTEPACLELEITESSVMSEPTRSLETLTELREMGIGLSLDDYGTGYSSLSYLKRLPIEELKIDRSFVMTMATKDNDAVIVRSTIELAHNLGLRVVAEGVEDEDAWNRLRSLGADVAQGYYLSRPLSNDRLLAWIYERTGASADVKPSLRLIS